MDEKEEKNKSLESFSVNVEPVYGDKVFWGYFDTNLKANSTEKNTDAKCANCAYFEVRKNEEEPEIEIEWCKLEGHNRMVVSMYSCKNFKQKGEK